MNTKFSQLTILYVEDDEIIRKNALLYLNTICKKVWGAKDGLEAFKLYESLKPDIIISDIKMPHLNGLDMVKKIRKTDKNTPVILATAFTDTTYLLQAVELQLIKYLIKPITPNKLSEALDAAYAHLYSDEVHIVSIGKDCIYDTLNKTVLIQGILIKLTHNELLLLDLLAKNQQRAVTYSEIENYIWLDTGMNIDTLRALVRLLRKKLKVVVIENISSIGYKLKK